MKGNIWKTNETRRNSKETTENHRKSKEIKENQKEIYRKSEEHQRNSARKSIDITGKINKNAR